jgi:hypothetical protein
MAREDQRRVTVSVDGVGSLGVFDSKTGGNADSEETKYRPGGMATEISLGGPQTMENVTVGRLFDLFRDLPVLPQLFAARGKASVTITDQPLDADGNAFGKPVVYHGKLKAVQMPDHDSNSNDAAKLELECSIAGTPA